METAGIDHTFLRALVRSVTTRAAGLRANLGAAGRRFSSRLRERRAERQPPVNYKSLSIEETQLRYVDLSGRLFVVVFDEIRQIEFVREPALFDDLYGPYLETKWRIRSGEGFAVEIMDEEAHRQVLQRAFARVLPGFREAAVAAGLASEEEGVWPCFSRLPPEAAPA